jgi:hypothetical protein
MVLALCCVWAVPSAAAAPVASPVAGPVVGSVVDIMSDRTRMIQVTCVAVAVGIFLLTRSYR